MDSLETAIYESLDPLTTQDKRLRALETLEKAKAADNSWQLCMEKLFGTRKVEVQFWCLQNLSDIINSSSWSNLNTSVKLFVREALTFYYFGVHFEDWDGCEEALENWRHWRKLFSETSLEASVPNFVRNKCAQLVSSLVAQEYPHSWPNIFRRLFSILPKIDNMKQTCFAADIELLHRFFLMLHSLDEDFISLSAIQRCGEIGTRLRDALRIDCIQQVVSLAIQLSHLYDMTNNSKLEEVCCLSLDICRRFVEWIDISLVMDQVFISTVFSMMIHSGKQCAQSISARIFLEIISKKMNLERKYQLLHSLNLNQFLNHLSTALKEASTNHSVEENPRTVDYLEQLGYHAFEVEIVALVNVIAAEALELMKALKRHSLSSVDISQVIEWTRNCLPIIIQCFQIEDEKMGRDTLEFFMSYINNCKDLSDDIGCTFILSIIWDQLILTEEKTLTEEKLIQLQEQRGRILTLFKNICRVYPALAMETIQNRLEQLHQVQGWDMPILEEMECIYCMTNAFVELTHKTKEWDYFVFRILSVLPKLEWFSVWSDSNAHSRQWIMEQLIIAYDNLLSHSMNLVESDMSLTYNVLIYLMDERGLRNPYSSKLRNKAASSLLRLARPLRQILATHFFELIITNLESVVLQSSQNMHASHILQLDRSDHIGLPEKLFLIEVVGIVLGSCWDSGFSSECEMRLESWLFKLITTLESCIGTQNVSLGYCIMEALTCIAKGFTLDRQDREDNKPSHGNHHASLQQEWNMSYSERVVSNSIDYLTSCWKRCFPVVFQFLQNYGSLSVTKEKCLIFLHRMVETLGEEALPFIQSSCLELIALHTNPTELTDIFLLINQIIVRLKGQARSFLFAIFQPLLQSFCHYFRSSNEYLQYFMEDPLHSRSEIWRENIELLKTFHLFVYHLVTQHLEDLLLLPTHQHFLLFCLGTLVDAVSISTHNVTVDFLRTECKYAWIVVRKLVLQPNADTLNLECTGFSLRQWITRTFVPLSLLLLFRLEWKKSNKVHLGIIEEIVEFYMACTTIPDWETCFHQSLSELPQIPSSTCQELFLVCKQQDKKTLYAFLINRLSKE